MGSESFSSPVDHVENKIIKQDFHQLKEENNCF